MNCQQLIDSLAEAFEDRLPLPERRRAETHLAECLDCVDYAESYRATIALARGVYDPLAAGEPAPVAVLLETPPQEDLVPEDLVQAVLRGSAPAGREPARA